MAAESLDVRVALLENNVAIVQSQLITLGKDFDERLRESENRILHTLETRISYNEEQLKLLSSKMDQISADIVRLNNAEIEDKARQQQTVIAVVIIVAIIEAFFKLK